MPVGITPIYKLMRDGVDITDKFNDRTTSIKVELNSGDGANDSFEIRIDDRDWLLAVPDQDTKIDVYLGYQEVGLSYLGQFTATDVFMEGPPRTMRITGLAAEVRSLMKTPTIKEFAGKTVKEIMQEIAKDRGVGGVHVDEEIGKIKIPYLNQTVSNYHLLTEIERRIGGILSFTPEGIVMRKRDGGETVSEKELPTLVLRPEHLNSWSTRITERYNYSHVEAAYMNKDTLKREWVTKDLFTTLDENKFPIGRMFNSKEEAEAAAGAKANSFRRGKIQGNFILAKGDPWVTSQMPVVVQEMRDGINGRYVVDKVTHTYVKDQGIQTTIECNSPGDGNGEDDLADKKFYFPQPGEVLGQGPPQVGQGPRGDN